MKKISIYIVPLLFLISSGLSAQVMFKLDLLEDNATFQISMVSEETWSPPHNLTSTAQVTLKVASGQFKPVNFVSMQSGVVWEESNHVVAPQEAPEYDYFSFVLVNFGTTGLRYEAGKEIPLFTFQNEFSCSGSVSLFENDKDPFRAPNSRQANVGNQITTLGARGDAFVGISGPGTVDCRTTTSVTNLADKAAGVDVHPNPAGEFVNISFDWDLDREDGQITLYNLVGQQAHTHPIIFHRGNNKIQLGLTSLPAGFYDVCLEGNSWKQSIRKLVVVKR